MLDDATYAAVTNLCAEERRDERERIATAVGALGCYCAERTNNPGRPHDENCPAGIAERVRSGEIGSGARGGRMSAARDEIHLCTVCGHSSQRHPEQCACGCGEFFWPALCCEGCGCGSFEEAHRARDEMRAEVNGRRTEKETGS